MCHLARTIQDCTFEGMKSQTSLPRNTLHIPKWFLADMNYELNVGVMLTNECSNIESEAKLV
jgi:hypothetical protein